MVDNDPGDDPPVESSPASASSDPGGRWLIWVLVAASVFIGGGVFYHLSSENAQKWFLEVREGSVIVRKGIWFPTGAADFEAGGRAYEPLLLEAGTPPPERVHDSLESVDKALYRILMGSAAGAIDSGDAARINRAKKLLSRARLLAGISDEEADEVLRYRGDIAMAEGHMAIREVRALLERAKRRVDAGASRGTRLYKDPHGWARWIDNKLEEFSGVEDARQPPPPGCPPAAAEGAVPPRTLAAQPPTAPATSLGGAEAAGMPASPAPAPGSAPAAPTIADPGAAPPPDASGVTPAPPTAPTAPTEPTAPTAPKGGLSFPLFPPGTSPPSPQSPSAIPRGPSGALPPAPKAQDPDQGAVRL